MTNSHWSSSEKKIAQRVYRSAVDRELAEIMADFKERAANARTPADIWAVEHHLTRTRKQFDSKYDFRYSQLTWVFGILLREKRIEVKELDGLAEEKLRSIQALADILENSGK
ncbi:MAG TPA: hypothetical protein VK843_16745 [Planctomycetota bacterium]|nr:hypothetical protein [Planctomycetota bacterium]